MSPRSSRSATAPDPTPDLDPDVEIEPGLLDELILPQRMVDPKKLIPHPGNPRVHNDTLIGESISQFGLYQTPTINDRTGRLIRGHGTVENWIRKRPGKPIQVSVIDVDDETATRILLMDNASSDRASNNPQLLADMLLGLRETEQDLAFTGFVPDDLQAILDSIPTPDDLPDDDGDGEDELGPGDSMALAGVTMGNPPIKTHRGEVWSLDYHLLVVADVHREWATYTHLLKPGNLFWPYPTLLAPFTIVARETPVVMVQPSTYLAGWLLVKWQRVTGRDPIRMVGK